jgi:site-specific recombinase XerD
MEFVIMQAGDLNGILADYATHLAQSRRFGAAATAAYVKAARELIEAVETIPHALLLPPQSGLEAIDKRALEIYLRYLQTSRGWRQTTLAAHLGALRAFFTYLVRSGRQERNPARGLSIRVSKGTPPLPEGDEARVRALLVTGASGLPGCRVRLLAELIYGGGLRPAKAFALQDLEVKRKRGLARLRWAEGEQELPLSPEGLERAEAYLAQRERALAAAEPEDYRPFWIGARGRALSAAALGRQLHNAMERAGLEGGPGALRKLAARHFRERGADLRSLRQFLGARRLGGLERYQPSEWRAVAEAFRKHHPRRDPP